MVAVEFQADVDDGKIEIPDQYRAQVGRHVRDILLADGAAPKNGRAFARLFDRAPRVADFKPLSRDDAHERH
jgi:hypothetical protein